MGISLLQTLTGRPVHNLFQISRQLLRHPAAPDRWQPPGAADASAGAWPPAVATAVAGAVEGLVYPRFADERLRLPDALQQLQAALTARVRHPE